MVNQKINDTLEDMCIYGNITKKEIKEEKEKNPEKFMDIEEALKIEDQNQGLFALGLLSKKLNSLGIEAVIEKNEKKKNLNKEEDEKEDENEDENDDEQDAAATCLQFITNGMCQKKKYELKFDFGEERNEQLLNDENEFEKFKEKLKSKLSRDYNVPIDKIIVTFPQKGSLDVQVIFQNDEFNNLDLAEFKKKFQDEKEFEELKSLKEIHRDVIMGACKLTIEQLDARGNRSEGWGEGEQRGGKDYDPPLGWIGIGLKVLDKYENNIWIGMDNVEGEWCVA